VYAVHLTGGHEGREREGNTMKAIKQERYGSADALEFREYRRSAVE